jgi:hypothetical protein
MKVSLRTLTIFMMLGGPGLAMLWWLRHEWSIQVCAIIVSMVVALSLFCGVAELLVQIVRTVVRKFR